MKSKGKIVYIFFGVLFSMVCHNSYAQEVETLLNIPTDFKVNGYFQLDLKFSELINDDVRYVGVKAGAAFDKTIGLGLTAGAFVTKNYFEAQDFNPSAEGSFSYLMGYTGLFVEYIAMANRKIHFSVPLNFGPGLISLYSQGEMSGQGINDEDLAEITAFMVYEPAVNLELNIIKELKLIAGLGYRFVRGSKLDALTDGDLSGLNFNLGLRFSGY